MAQMLLPIDHHRVPAAGGAKGGVRRSAPRGRKRQRQPRVRRRRRAAATPRLDGFRPAWDPPRSPSRSDQRAQHLGHPPRHHRRIFLALRAAGFTANPRLQPDQCVHRLFCAAGGGRSVRRSAGTARTFHGGEDRICRRDDRADRVRHLGPDLARVRARLPPKPPRADRRCALLRANRKPPAAGCHGIPVARRGLPRGGQHQRNGRLLPRARLRADPRAALELRRGPGPSGMRLVPGDGGAAARPAPATGGGGRVPRALHRLQRLRGPRRERTQAVFRAAGRWLPRCSARTNGRRFSS